MPKFSAHFSRFSRSFCSLLWSFWLLISRYNRQSSAKSRTDDYKLTASGRSFMGQIHSMGPSIVPCGTPEYTVTCWDDSPSNVTLIFLFVRNFVSHLCTRYDNVTLSPLLLGLEQKRTEGYVIVSICVLVL